MADTACPTCGALYYARTWDPHVDRPIGERWFVEFYGCGAVRQWGAGAVELLPCPSSTATLQQFLEGSGLYGLARAIDSESPAEDSAPVPTTLTPRVEYSSGLAPATLADWLRPGAAWSWIEGVLSDADQVESSPPAPRFERRTWLDPSRPFRGIRFVEAPVAVPTVTVHDAPAGATPEEVRRLLLEQLRAEGLVGVTDLRLVQYSEAERAWTFELVAGEEATDVVVGHSIGEYERTMDEISGGSDE